MCIDSRNYHNGRAEDTTALPCSSNTGVFLQWCFRSLVLHATLVLLSQELATLVIVQHAVV